MRSVWLCSIPFDITERKLISLERPLALLRWKLSLFEAKNSFPLGPDPLGTVVAGAPHAKVLYGSFLGLTQQAYKVALSSGFCWRFHRGEKCSGCNFKHECFRCGSHHPANQCHFPKQQANSTKAVPRPKSTAVTANNSAPTSSTVSSIGNANQNR